MIKWIKNVSGSQIHLKDIGIKIDNNEEREIEDPQLYLFLNSSQLVSKVQAGDIQVGNGTSYYTDEKEGELYLKTLFDDKAYIIDDGDNLSEYAPAIVEDSNTSYKSTSVFMNLLTMMRELYNAESNPIYDASFTPILGSSGWAEDHSDRIDDIETIHGKLGWHNQQVVKSLQNRPKDLLIYYGWMNSFNSAQNGWSNELVAQEMAKYGLIVLGDGIQDSGHGDYSNTSVIIPRIKALNPNTLIFGYVSTDQSIANFEDKVDDWETLEVHGIFMDESGYDFGRTRSEFNTRVDYVHSMNYANLCFVNAWNMDHIIGTTNDASYPNSTYNSSAAESNLTSNDWYLLESFAINSLSYENDYASKTEWAARGVKAIGHRNTYGINLAGSNVIEDGMSGEQTLFNFCFVAALMFSLEANGSSDHYYGSSSAKGKFYTRSDINGINCWSLNPSVQVDNSDSDVYHRYVDFGRLLIDWSSSAETSSITKY